MSNLYSRIEELCKTRGTNITEMCRASGASRGSLTDLKKGRTSGLNTGTLEKLSAYFGVSVDYLLGNEQQKKPTPEGERNYEDMELLAAFRNADESTKAAIRLLLKVE